MIPELIALEKQNELLTMIGEERWKNEPEEVIAYSAARTSLMYGDTYFWSADMCDLIGSAARKLKDSWTLTREMVPSNNGFFYFDKPPSHFRPMFVRTEWADGEIDKEVVTGDNRKVLWLRAISWTTYKYRMADDVLSDKGREYFGIGGLNGGLNGGGIIAEMDRDHEWGTAISSAGQGNLDDADGIVICFWVDNPNLGRSGIVDQMSIKPNGYCQWRFGKTSDDMIIAEAMREGIIESGGGGGGDVEELKLAIDEMNESGRMDNQVICTAFSFLLEDIVNGKERVGMDRAARKRIERKIDKGEETSESAWVKIIKLRKVRHPLDGRDLDDTREGREFHCRWVVSGHWRKQWYPSLEIHQPKWILPYVKGVEGMPWKETEVIRSVRR